MLRKAAVVDNMTEFKRNGNEGKNLPPGNISTLVNSEAQNTFLSFLASGGVHGDGRDKRSLFIASPRSALLVCHSVELKITVLIANYQQTRINHWKIKFQK